MQEATQAASSPSDRVPAIDYASTTARARASAQDPPRPPDSAATKLLAWTDAHRWWIWAGIVLLYLLGFNGHWRLAPDTALNAVVARNVAEGAGFTHPAGLHTAISPGLPWLIAGTFRLFGTESLLPAQVIMWLLAMAALALVYQLVKLHTDRAVAISVTVMVAVTERFYRYAFDLMADLPFLVGLLLFLVGYEATFRGSDRANRRAWPWLAMTLGVFVMALFRSVVLVFLAALVVTTVWHLITRRAAGRHLLILACAAGALLLARHLDPRLEHAFDRVPDEQMVEEAFEAPAGTVLGRIFTKNLPRLLEESAVEAFFGVEVAPVLNSLICVAVIVLGVALFRRRALWGVLTAAFVVQIIVFYYVAPRYFLVILPLLVLAVWLSADGLNRRVRQPLGAWLALAIAIGWCAPNTGKVVGDILEQRHPRFYKHYADGRFLSIDKLGHYVDRKLPKDAVLVATRYDLTDPLTYYTRRPVYPLFRLHKAFARGKPVYYIDYGTRQIPRRIKNRDEYELGETIRKIPRRRGIKPWTIRPMTMKQQAPATKPATRPAKGTAR